MKKRIISLLLALVTVFGVMTVGVTPVSAASGMKTSDDCIELLKQEEGFSKKPYWDYAQYTIGYGTACPADMLEYYTENGITKKEASTLLRNHLRAIEKQINKKIIDKYELELTQNQFDAIVLFSYNCGTGWTGESTGTYFNAIVKGATGNDLIRAFALWCSAGGQIKTFLLRRRLCEANIYLNGIYSKTAPENYKYVLYDANGGTTSPKSQGYDSDLTAEPFPVPKYGKYTFDGWYTQKKGGEKVTVLDASTAGATLYAHWLDSKGNEVEEKKEENIKVKIKVTGDEVNVRKGPGTNYASVGTVKKGDKLTITQTAYGSDYQWGKFKDGWICLDFTNFEEVMSKQDEPTNETKPEETTPEETKPEETEPEETKPEETEPEETKPEETKPEETKPEETKPEETEPEETEPEKEKVMGTVKVNDWLRVRSGPSTGYSEVRKLKPNDRVEILEQKVVGAMVWGKISDGWVSMDYIVLDKKTETNTGSTSSDSSKITGTVNVNDWLRVRSGAGTSYSIAGYLKPGEKVTITKTKTVNGTKWGKIKNGWVSMEYIKLDKKSENTNQSTTTDSKKITGTVNVSDWLRVRSGAGTSYSIAGYLKPGEKITVTKTKTVNGTKWGKIEKGWVSMDYIKVDSASSNSTTTEKPATAQKKTVTADCLCVRSGAGTDKSIVGYLYEGTKVTVTETKKVSGKSWGKVENGWICMDYVK